MSAALKWVVTYTACPLRKLTWIVNYMIDAAKIDTFSQTSKFSEDFFR